MADARARRIVKRYELAKSHGLPLIAALAGISLRLIWGFSPAEPLLALLGPLTGVFPGVKTWLTTAPVAIFATGWLAAPVGLYLLGRAFVKLWPVRRALDRLFPTPPAFVRADLDRFLMEGMSNFERQVPDLVGRSEELDTLSALFAETEGNTDPLAFRWRALTGPSGVGKTRLAVEWLRIAQAQGWHVGVVDRSADDLVALATWKPGRRAALVIDEAGTIWGSELQATLTALQAAASAKAPVRVLVIDHIMPVLATGGLPERQKLAAAAEPEMRVGGLGGEALSAMLQALTLDGARAGEVAQLSGGRPRAAILLSRAPDARSYGAAIDNWVEALIPELASQAAMVPSEISVPLILAALIGPVESDVIREHVPGFNAGYIMRFFEDQDRRNLERQLPMFQPDDLGAELALRLLAVSDSAVRQQLLDTMVRVDPDRLEKRLATLWQSRVEAGLYDPDSRAGDDMLRWLQNAYQAARPEHVAAIVNRLAAVIPEMGGDNASDAQMAAALREAEDRMLARPFDSNVHLVWNAVVAITVNRRGATSPDDAGVLVERMLQINAFPGAQRTTESDGNAAEAIYRLVYHLSQKERWQEVEDWRHRLLALEEGGGILWDAQVRQREGKIIHLTLVSAVRRGDGDAAAARIDEYRTMLGEVEGREKTDLTLDLLDGLHGAATAISGTDGAMYAEWTADLALEEFADPRLRANAKVRQRVFALLDSVLYQCMTFDRPDVVERLDMEIETLCAEFAGEIGDAAERLVLQRRLMEAAAARGDLVRAEYWAQAFFALLPDAGLERDALPLVSFAFNVYLDALARTGEIASLELWREKLLELSKAGEGDLQRNLKFLAVLVQRNVISFHCLQTSPEWPDLEAAGVRIQTLTGEMPDTDAEDARVIEASGMFGIAHVYGELGRIKEMERWAAGALEQVQARGEDKPLLEATGHLSCPIVHYAEAGRFDDMERWGAVLTGFLVQERWAQLDSTWLQMVRGAGAAIDAYQRAGLRLSPRWEFWRVQLVKAAKRLPGNAEAQALANRIGATFAEQTLADLKPPPR